MQAASERWVEVTPSRFPHERAGLDAVRELLPDAEPHKAWSNLEIITDRGRSLEVDLLVAGPGGLYVVELKAWSGRITSDRYLWQLHGARATTQENPWRLVNDKAKVLKGLLDGEVRRLLRERAGRRPRRAAAAGGEGRQVPSGVPARPVDRGGPHTRLGGPVRADRAAGKRGECAPCRGRRRRA